MNNFLIACCAVLIFSANAFSSLIYISTEESVKRSDFIVVGTLQSVSDIIDETGFNSGNGEGVLVVDKIIAGNVLTGEKAALKSGDRLRLKWSELSACLSGWHKRTENEKGVWLLVIDEKGIIETSHPAQFAPFRELPEIEKYIEKYWRKFSKTVSTRTETVQNSNAFQPDSEPRPVIAFEATALSKTKTYYPSRAFLTFLFWLSLYYLLYHSRYKIR